MADALAPVRAGVVGFGLAGRVFHAAFIAAVPSLSLQGIVQRTGNDAARAYPAATVYRTVEELLRSDVELVVIATPNATHVDFATAAVKAGKHVVIDSHLHQRWRVLLNWREWQGSVGVWWCHSTIGGSMVIF